MTTETRPTEHEAPAIEFTEAARERITSFIANQGKPNLGLRVAIQGRSGAGFRYAMGVVDLRDREASDVEFDGGGFAVVVDADSLEDLRGAKVDFVETPAGSGLQVDNPNPVWRDEVAQLVQAVIDNQINPGVASHGGWVELLGVKEDIAFVRLGGGCQGCGMADVTLKQGIETLITEHVPQITRVMDQTDHAAGTNPYYQPAKA
jgi:Fe/S biogenesis protein NfuA